VLESLNRFSSHGNVSKSLSDFSSGKSRASRKDYSPLVNIADYCLMPNHYHLIVEQLVDGGISKFLQKVMTSYTMYFNKKYERSGVLFQGKTKSKFITSDLHHKQVKIYIDLNPVDLCDKDWKERGKVTSLEKTKKFLNDFKWSSCKDYSGYIKYLDGSKKLGLLEHIED
jgi:putative transposase